MKKLLLIDDNETQHELFRCYAMQTDVELVHALSLEQAVDTLKEDEPDMIFLDNRLAPYNDFRQTAPAIREAGFDGKIVVISSDVKHPLFNEASDYTIDTYLNKFEFNLSNFSDMLNSLVKSKPHLNAVAG